MLIYTVARKYAKGPEQQIGEFANVEEAKIFINQKLLEDRHFKVMASYLLYDLGDLVETFDQGSVIEPLSSGGQQASSGQQFSPSPLQTNLRPGGLPPSSFKDDDDKAK